MDTVRGKVGGGGCLVSIPVLSIFSISGRVAGLRSGGGGRCEIQGGREGKERFAQPRTAKSVVLCSRRV